MNPGGTPWWDMVEPDPALAQQLFEARNAANLTQEQLAAKLGISRVQVGRIESGKRGTYVALVRRWMQACGRAVDSVAIGHGPRTGELAEALADISDADLVLVLRLMRVLPSVDAFKRKLLLDIIETHEPHT